MKEAGLEEVIELPLEREVLGSKALDTCAFTAGEFIEGASVYCNNPYLRMIVNGFVFDESGVTLKCWCKNKSQQVIELFFDGEVNDVYFEKNKQGIPLNPNEQRDVELRFDIPWRGYGWGVYFPNRVFYKVLLHIMIYNDAVEKMLIFDVPEMEFNADYYVGYKDSEDERTTVLKAEVPGGIKVFAFDRKSVAGRYSHLYVKIQNLNTYPLLICLSYSEAKEKIYTRPGSSKIDIINLDNDSDDIVLDLVTYRMVMGEIKRDIYRVTGTTSIAQTEYRPQDGIIGGLMNDVMVYVSEEV